MALILSMLFGSLSESLFMTRPEMPAPSLPWPVGSVAALDCKHGSIIRRTRRCGPRFHALHHRGQALAKSRIPARLECLNQPFDAELLFCGVGSFHDAVGAKIEPISPGKLHGVLFVGRTAD